MQTHTDSNPEERRPDRSSNESLALTHNNALNPFSGTDSDCSVFERLNAKKDAKRNRRSTGSQSSMQRSQEITPQKQASTKVQYTFTWSYGGNIVYLVGSFTEWKDRLPMKRVGREFSYSMWLERCVHEYKFVVDNDWRYATDQPNRLDGNGNTNNYVDLTNH